MAVRAIADAFTGRQNTLRIKLKNTPLRIMVMFGEIRIPVLRTEINLDELEKVYSCKIKKSGNFYRIIPNIVGKIIEKDGVIMTIPEHQKELEGWLKVFPNLLAKFV